MRCKACNAVLEPSEIIWNEKTKEHEELCKSCREILDNESDTHIHYEQGFDLFDDGYEDS